MKRIILLQCKFVLMAWVNFTLNFLPPFLRRFYLKLFGIRIGKNSTIHRGSKFFHTGNFTMGINSVVNFGCYLDNRRGIIIGDNVGIAHNTKIYTLGHDLKDPSFRTKGSTVIIEDNVFIFSNCLIMPGVTIQEGAIVLAGSVVTKSIEAFAIVGGNPAQKIFDRNKEIAYVQNYQFMYAL